MEKKRVIQKIKEVFGAKPIDGNTPQPLTNGNKYEVYNMLKNQEELDLATVESLDRQLKNSVRDINEMTAAIRRVSDYLIREKNIDPYFLLQMQGDYFCNTCRFETKDRYLKRLVINVIRGAFLMGCAGIYKNITLNILEPVYITGLEYGIDGKLKSAKILPLDTCMQKMNQIKTELTANDFKGMREVKDCDNLAVFSWGTMGYSAWITKWPFVKLQHLFLTIIIINGFVFNKKWIYKINNFTNIADEIKLFFDPANPFIVNVGSTEDLANRFATEEKGNSAGNSDVIDYYNKMIGVYYQLMGRKINSDYKKERNVSDEVEASQENFDVVQNDWLAQFELFIEDLKAIGMQIDIVKQEEMKEEKEEEENADNSEGNNGE